MQAAETKEKTVPRPRSGRVPVRGGKNPDQGRAGLPGAGIKDQRSIASIFQQLTSTFLKPKSRLDVLRLYGESEHHNIAVKFIKKYYHLLPKEYETDGKTPEAIFTDALNAIIEKVQKESGNKSGIRYYEDSNELFRLDAYDLSDQFEFIPIMWFELYRTKNKKLYNLIMDTLHFASEKTKLYLPMQSGSEEASEFEMLKDEFECMEKPKREDAESKEEYAEMRLEYAEIIKEKKELIDKWLKIKSHVEGIENRKVKLKNYCIRVNRYKGRSKHEKLAIEWMKSAIKMFECKHNMSHFFAVPDNNNDNDNEFPVEPSVYNRFVWDCSEGDFMWDNINYSMDETYGNYGALPFYHKYPMPFKGKKKEAQPELPMLLRDFMDKGYKFYYNISIKYGHDFPQ